MDKGTLEKQCISLASALGVPSVSLDSNPGEGLPSRMFFILGGKPLLVSFDEPHEVENKNSTRVELLKKLGYITIECANLKIFMVALKELLTSANKEVS